ncbi:molybdopterin-guanine dinucleotide biosynthesis protein B [Alteribacillus sp. HJP-4]
MEALIKSLSGQGFRVAAIKHHGHGGRPDPGMRGKDSERHEGAGAIAAGVHGEDRLQLSLPGNWALSSIITFYEALSPDFIVVEGYKKEKYPKVLVLGSAADKDLLKSAVNVKAVIVSDRELLNIHSDSPVFMLSDKTIYVRYLQKVMTEENKK